MAYRINAGQADFLGNLAALRTRSSNFAGIDAVDRMQRRTQAFRCCVFTIFPAETPDIVAMTGGQQLLEARGPAQRIGVFKQVDERRRTQFGGTVNVAVVTGGEQGQITAIDRNAQTAAERSEQINAALFVAEVARQ